MLSGPVRKKKSTFGLLNPSSISNPTVLFLRFSILLYPRESHRNFLTSANRLSQPRGSDKLGLDLMNYSAWSSGPTLGEEKPFASHWLVFSAVPSLANIFYRRASHSFLWFLAPTPSWRYGSVGVDLALSLDASLDASSCLSIFLPLH